MYGVGVKAAALADEAHTMLERAATPYARAELALLESRLAYAAGDAARARLLGLRAAHEDPENERTWPAAVAGSQRQKGEDVAAASWQAWAPEYATAWNSGAIAEEHGDLALRIRFSKRAGVLDPYAAVFDLNLADYLFAAGDREAVRSLAARRSSGDAQQQATAEALLIRVDAADGHLGSALSRARAALQAAPSIGRVTQSAGILLSSFTMELALILGRGAEVSDELARRFVLSEPPRLVQNSEFSVYMAIHTCVLASPEVAVACADRVRRLIDDGYFRRGYMGGTLGLVEGVERFVRGDKTGAVDAFRVLLQRGRPAWLLGYVLEAAGQDDLSARVDAPTLERPAFYNGVSRRTCGRRGARTSAAMQPRARELARAVVDAWGVADVEVPAVAEMRALLAKR